MGMPTMDATTAGRVAVLLEAALNKTEAAVYTIPDLAEKLKVSERHIHRMRANKQIPGEVRYGTRAVRFVKSIVDKWLSEGGAA